MWDGISGLLESIASIIFLGEKLSTSTQYLGLGLYKNTSILDIPKET